MAAVKKGDAKVPTPANSSTESATTKKKAVAPKTTPESKAVAPKTAVKATKQEATAKATPPKQDAAATTAPPSATEPTAASEAMSKLNALMVDFSARLHQNQMQSNSIRNDFKVLEKQLQKEFKTLAKSGRRNKKATTRAPSGFVKPTLISDDLAAFLNKEKGIQMARTDVTREINAYIREHNLQDKQNGRRIIADQKLTRLLNLQTTDELTYFNLQKYMSPHFHKETPATAVAPATIGA